MQRDHGGPSLGLRDFDLMTHGFVAVPYGSAFTGDKAFWPDLDDCTQGFITGMAEDVSHSQRQWVLRKPDGAYQLCGFSDIHPESLDRILGLCRDYQNGDRLSFDDGVVFWNLLTIGQMKMVGFNPLIVGLCPDGLIRLRDKT